MASAHQILKDGWYFSPVLRSTNPTKGIESEDVVLMLCDCSQALLIPLTDNINVCKQHSAPSSLC